MKNSIVSFLATVVLVSLLGSCVSMQDRMLSIQENAEANIVGSVTVTYHSFRFLHFIGGTRNKAYRELMEEARKQYEGNIVIRNISITGSGSIVELIYGAGSAVVGTVLIVIDSIAGDGSFVATGVGLAVGLNLAGHFQKITATGDVVLLGSASSRSTAPVPANMQKIDTAINAAASALINDMPANATIAILSVYADDRSATEYVIDELEFQFVESKKFKIVDRHRLEQVRREQNFQLSGDVDDNSAVSIGNMLGASIVITGDISGSDSSGRLVLRALDVKTAQIVTMARERF